MSSRKAEIYQLACVPFHIYRGCAVIGDYERVGALKKSAHELQPNFHLVLHAYYHKHLWIIFINLVVGLIVRECRVYKQDVGELATERAWIWSATNPDLPEFLGPTMRALNGMLLGFTAISVLHRF